MHRKHPWAGDDARLDMASTRNRDAFGKRQFTSLYSTAATYSCLHLSPPPLPINVSAKKGIGGSELVRLRRQLKGAHSVEIYISSSVEETHTGNNSKRIGLLSKTDL